MNHQDCIPYVQVKSHFLAVGVHGLYSISGNFLIQPLFDLNIWVRFPWGGETLLRFHGSPNGKMVRSSAWSIPVFNEFNGLPMFDRWIPMKSHKLQFHVCSSSKSVHCVWPSQPRQWFQAEKSKLQWEIPQKLIVNSIISHHLYIDIYIYWYGDLHIISKSCFGLCPHWELPSDLQLTCQMAATARKDEFFGIFRGKVTFKHGYFAWFLLRLS